jgi:hypothetical protein
MTSRSEGGGSQGLCDNSAKPSVIKCVTMGAGRRGIKKCSILRDVFYGRPLRGHSNNMSPNTQEGEGQKRAENYLNCPLNDEKLSFKKIKR